MGIEISQQNGLAFDIPAEAIPSSIGPLVWPPRKDNENRTRGILTQVIDERSFFDKTIKDFSELPLNNEITRNSGRIFVTNNILSELPEIEKVRVDPYIEAIVPLEGCGIEALEDVSMIYLGHNDPTRLLPKETMDMEMSLAKKIFEESDPPKFHSHDGIDFRVIDSVLRNDAEIQRQLADLYSAFDWTPKDVIKILNNQNNFIVGALDNNGLLISTGMAERVSIPLKRGAHSIDFVMYEITEAATREEYRGRGLYLAIALIINRLLTETDANLVYGELNLSSPGVIKAAYRQGRHFTLDNFTKYGLTQKPLRQPVRISGGLSDDRPNHLKNDLLVTYLTRGELIQKHGKKSN